MLDDPEEIAADQFGSRAWAASVSPRGVRHFRARRDAAAERCRGRGSRRRPWSDEAAAWNRSIPGSPRDQRLRGVAGPRNSRLRRAVSSRSPHHAHSRNLAKRRRICERNRRFPHGAPMPTSTARTLKGPRRLVRRSARRGQARAGSSCAAS